MPFYSSEWPQTQGNHTNQYSARIKSMSHRAWLAGYRLPICEEKIKGITYSIIPKTRGSESLRKFKLAIPRKVSPL